MPHDYNGKVAVKASELIPRWYSSIAILSKQLTRDKDKSYGMKRLQSAGNGRELLIDFDTLDIEIRNALGDPRKVTNWMDKFFTMDTEASQFYSGYRFDGGGGLGNEHIEEYTINASTLRACKLLKEARERERRSKGGSLRGVPHSIWNEAMLYRAVQRMKFGFEHTLPSNERRFTEACKRFDDFGFVALISGKHNNKNAVKVTADVMELLNNLFAGTNLKPSPTDVTRQYMRFLVKDIEVVSHETGEVISPDGYPDLSDTTIMGYLAKWDARIGTHAKRSGNRQTYMNQYKAFHSLDRPKYSGSLLSVDDRNPPFVMADGKRVWFYCGIDLHSEAWTVWVHGKTKEGIIVDFYRQLIRNYAKWGIGLPLELECESSLNSTLRDGLLQDGRLFEKVRIEANNATGKKIERYFRELRYGKEKELEGWQARPFARNEANQAKDEKKVILSYGQISEQTIKAMEEWNNEPHPITKDKTRWEVFIENQNKKCRPICWEQVLPYVGYETKSSCKTGFVALNGESFCIGNEKGSLATGEILIQNMKLIEGKTVTVKWLDDDEGNVIKAFAYRDNRIMCELVKKPTYNRASFEREEQDEENYALMSAYSNTITAFGTKQRKNIESITILKRTAQADEEIQVAEVLPNLDDEQEITYKMPKKAVTLWDRF